MNNLFQLTVIVKKNDGTERKAFKVIQVTSCKRFRDAIQYFAMIYGLCEYQKSKKSKFGYPIGKVHRHYYKNGVVRVQPLEIQVY
jgi:hypothetical protein